MTHARFVSTGRFLRSNPSATWVAVAVACLGIAAPAGGLLTTGIAAPAVSAVVAALLCELLWRFDLRPRLLWNDGGVTIVHPLSVITLRWNEIATITTTGNTIHVSGHDWEFDRYWWLARLSPAYAQRQHDLVATLTDALERGREGGEPPSDIPRRPVAFLLVIAATAVAGHFVAPLVA